MVYPHHSIYSEMFVVPVGALFAFTSIRANLPGAPDGFGKVFRGPSQHSTPAHLFFLVKFQEQLSVRMRDHFPTRWSS
jgi:hypothetical protein